MKKFFTICLLLGMAVFINANNDELYYNFANEQVLLDELDLFEYANFPEGTSFEIFQDEVDDLGIRHQSYQQMYQGIKVQSKMILVHSKNGQLLSLNGNVMKQNLAPKFIKQNLNKLQARKKVNSETDEKDITLTILCINGIYYTVYKVPNPETLETFYIDAESGEIVFVEPALQSADVKTQALTRYSGWQEMTMYETDGKYLFLDSARNIVTLGAKGSPNVDYYFSEDFILSLPDSIIQKLMNEDSEAIGNYITSPMMWDYINQCNILYNNSPVIYIPTITNITITSANSSWWYDIWDTKPDIFIEIYNSNNQLVYVSPTINDATFPISFPMSIAVADGYVIQTHFVGNTVFLAGLQDVFQMPIRVCIQVGQECIRPGGYMNFGNIGGIAKGQHLLINAAAANDHGALCRFSKLHRRLGAIAHRKAGNFPILPGQRHIDSAGQRFLPGKVLDCASAHDDHSAPGGLPEKFPVCAQRHRLGAFCTDTPVVIHSNDQFHNPPQIAMGISKSKGWN